MSRRPAKGHITTDSPLLLGPNELSSTSGISMRFRAAHDLKSITSENDALVSASQRARRLLRLNRSREALVDPDIFSNPAWIIMLDLFVRDFDGQLTTVMSACVGAGAPATTALRYLNGLVARGLVARNPSETDLRTIHVALTEQGRACMLELLCVS